MIKLLINDKKYQFPTEISLDEWIYLIRFDLQETQNWPTMISYLTTADLEDLKEADEETLELGVALIVQMMNDRKQCKMHNFEDLTFGQFVDIEVYQSFGIQKHIKDVIKILSEEAVMANEVMYVYETYLKWRENLMKQYKVLFGIDIKGGDEIDEETIDTDPQAIARSWYNVICELANDDILKLDEITEQPLRKVLNFMARGKQKMLEFNAQQIQNQRKYDLQANRR